MHINSILETIGNTPLLRLKNGGRATVLAKCEMLNPGGSIKDRIARYMVEQAEARGELKPGMTIVEASSGNTGIGLVLVGIQKGYRVVIVMPENMSEERKKIIEALGGQIILTCAKDSLDGCLAKVRELAAEGKVWLARQFENLDNPEIHYRETAMEIWQQTQGKIDAFVAGVGSGGTLQGVGRFLKEKNPAIKVVAVEPKNAAALLGQEPGLHQIQGIGDGFIPAVLDVKMIDDVITVSDEDAVGTARELAKSEGLLVGTSSGANVWASRKLAESMDAVSVVVTVLPDRAERYFSTALL